MDRFYKQAGQITIQVFPKAHNTFRARNVGRESELLLPVKDTGDLWRARDRISDAGSTFSENATTSSILAAFFVRQRSSLRDNKVTSRVYGEIEVFPHSPPRYCRLQLFNRAISMILPPLRRVAKGQQWFESCMRFRATSSRVWMDFFPSFLRLIMARIRRVRKQLYASKVSVYACCWFLLLIRRSIVCCTG